ncbi:MAG: hypothetical protein E3J87_06410 [Candidatus Cloacimonadota bacterium]|nr:MAG: hypothetical protein E3J87_06410 [Candidatus Cloacimonadota bacterium]
MEENKCTVCLSEGFKSGTLEGGICGQCKKLWPGAKTPEDRNKKKKPEVESYEATVKELVTKQVNELLESYGILHRCLICSNLYFKRSPAQKSCGCDKKESEAK